VARDIVNGVFTAYIFLLSLRLVLGWFSPRDFGKPWEWLRMVTDPYLGFFYRIKFLRSSLFDFTPIAAVLALVVALNLANQLLSYGRVSLGFFLASAASASWSGARFLILFFLIVGLLRTIPFFFRGIGGEVFWKVADLIVQPAVALVTRMFRFPRRLGYTQHLLFTIGLLFIAWILGEIAVWRILIPAFQALPI
jgi:uncharacterized protein YggT (Ycf19 family)